MLTGKRLSGRYHIERMIGGGGMAHVYLAYDDILNREVAVKVLRPDFADNEEFIERFHREAQAATSLSHPNIVNIYDVGEEDGIYFMVMEYVDGTTLKQSIQQRGAFSIEDSLHIMQQMTSAIQHAHENQIVHRDIKPHNILIDDHGNVKITDFGIAMALSATSITQTNSVLGSVHYLSPEQARGGMANKKSDIYSLGVVMFELLTGRLPFSGESAVSIALKHLQSETPSPRRWNDQIPQSVENIILKATAKDPFHRYESTEEMQEDLKTALQPERLNEPKFVLPDDDEQTKAIPVVTDLPQEGTHEETIVHQTQEKPSNEVKKPKKKKEKRWVWLTVLLAILLIGGAVAAFTLPSMFEEEQVEIPDVKGKDATEAVTMLQNAGLQVKTEKQVHQSIPEDHAIRTEPAAGFTVKKGFEVTLFESLGKEKVEFEDYVGRDLEEAKRDLRLKGINVEKNLITISVESDLPENQIVTQRQPTPGEKISPDELEETVVIFEISEGPKVSIPDMNGWTEEKANQFAKENGLTIGKVDRQYSEEVAEGHVISQTPSANTEVKKGATVDLTLSKGPSPKTTTVTKVIPYDSEAPEEKQRIDVYIKDVDNNIEDVALTEYMTESKAISFDVQVPYKGEASYKIYVNGSFFEGNSVKYSAVQSAEQNTEPAPKQEQEQNQNQNEGEEKQSSPSETEQAPEEQPQEE
ncbi:Stk1 family PASTA domain-containing Ser/Thr kinase [Bacillus tianshenii]|nr:Stk1 family PASTA domain-containing Ser/Thr kinase [Bacillus tianshenii]